MQLATTAQRGQIEIAAGPCHGHPLGCVAEAHVEHATLARDKLQAIVRAAEFHAQPVAAVPQHRVVALAAVSKAQAAAAAAGERPTVRPIPGRAVLRNLLALFAQQDRGASRGKIERRERGRAPRQRGKFPLDEADVDLVPDDLRMAQQRPEESKIRGDAFDPERIERFDQAGERLRPIGSPRDQLRQQRIVVGGDRVARAKAGVDPDAVPSRLAPCADGSSRGQKPLGGVLGINTCLHRMAVGCDLVLPQRQLFPHGDAQLPLHEVDAGDHLGHGMLDLQARIHLDEMKTGRIRDEFDRPGADITRGLGGGARRSRHRGTPFGRDGCRKRLLHHLLMPTLKRAFALEQRHHVALAVAEHLHFDMPRPGHVLLDQDLVIPKRGRRFAFGARDRFGERLGVGDQAHASAAAAR